MKNIDMFNVPLDKLRFNEDYEICTYCKRQVLKAESRQCRVNWSKFLQVFCLICAEAIEAGRLHA